MKQAFKCYRKYNAHIQKLLKWEIMILRSDSRYEFCSKEFDAYLNKKCTSERNLVKIGR